jgi:hypothetical protein
MESTSSILVFKTNIQSPDDVRLVKPLLDEHPHIARWNVDMDDIDCVLRIVSEHLTEEDVINLITPAGYACSGLE